MKILLISLFAYISINGIASAEIRNIDVGLDYFSDRLDIINYLDQIKSSSQPKSLRRHHIGYRHYYGFWGWSIRYTKEQGKVDRSEEPYLLTNNIDIFGISLFKTSRDHKHSLEAKFRYTKQSPIILDCISRETILLGGNCDNADFKLLDGIVYQATGERKYLPVLTTQARSNMIGLQYSYKIHLNRAIVKMSTGVDFYHIRHHSQSPLFDITSDFLLKSEIKGRTLQNVIEEIQVELPQSEPWHEAVTSVQLEVDYPILSGIGLFSTGIMYSEKFGYDGTQKFKVNHFAQLGYQQILSKHARVKLLGTIYRHYLQGVEPLLYTPKTSRFFEHPYGELSLQFTMNF